MAAMGGPKRTAIRCALATCALALLAFPASSGATPVPSSSRVTAFAQPDVPPTGGSEELIFGPDGQVWFYRPHAPNPTIRRCDRNG